MENPIFLKRLVQASQSGFEFVIEDRRNLLFELRCRENKTEAPHLTAVLAQQLLVDMLR